MVSICREMRSKPDVTAMRELCGGPPVRLIVDFRRVVLARSAAAVLRDIVHGGEGGGVIFKTLDVRALVASHLRTILCKETENGERGRWFGWTDGYSCGARVQLLPVSENCCLHRSVDCFR